MSPSKSDQCEQIRWGFLDRGQQHQRWDIVTVNVAITDKSLVVARFRPQNKVEVTHGGEPIVKFEGEDTCALNVCTTIHLR